MSDPDDPKMPKTPKAPPAPFPVDDREWESALAEWDARLPIATEGATPGEENPFIETPTTMVASEAQLAEAAAEDFAQGPPSGIYESIVASVGSIEAPPSLFADEPPPEDPVSLVVEPLPEMGEEPWRGDLRQVVAVPETLPPTEAASPAYWKTFGRQLIDELSVADTAAQQADLTVAAARAAERSGDGDDALGLYDDALILQPGHAAARRARFRLLEARGDRDGAFVALGRLVDAVSGDERTFYRTVQAEWALARGEKAAAAMPAGLSRWLAEAELAIRRDDPAAAAGSLEQAAYAVGGTLGAALLTAAARLHTVAGDVSTAAEQRFVAARLGGTTVAGLIGRLPDVARMSVDDEPGAAAALDELLSALPPSSALGRGVARWAARLARRRGDEARAAQILAAAAGAGDSPSLRRDRLELALGGRVFDRAVTETLVAAVAADSDADARASLAWRQARALANAGDEAQALSIAETTLGESPAAVPLALLAEATAAGSTGDQRALALRLWAAHDPARVATASWALAQAAGPASDAWREVARVWPSVPAFWKWSAASWAGGDAAGAARALEAGLETGAVGGLGPAWGERVAELSAAGSPARSPIALSNDKGDDGTEADADVATRAATLLERALAIPAADRNGRSEALEKVLAVAPEHPIALALLLVQGAHRPDAVATALWTLGTTAPGDGEGSIDSDEQRRAQLQAVEWLIQGSNRLRALELARTLGARHPDWPPARDVLRQLAVTGPSQSERARLLLSVVDPASSAAAALLLAEAHEQLGEREEALALFRRLAPSEFAGDAQRGLARLENTHEESPVSARFDGWLQAARAGRWGELCDRLENEPPTEEIAGAGTLYLAALLDDGRRDGKRSGRLIREAFAAASVRRGGAGPGLMPALRALDAALAQPDATPGEVVGAAQAVATRIARGEGRSAPRSAAAALVDAALALQARAHVEQAETLLRAALAHDPHSLPALAGLRSLLVDSPSWRDVVDLCEREAALLRVPAYRAATLLFAARVVLARGADDPSRAVSLLRQVLSIAPDNQDAFARLRVVLEEAGDDARVVELLAARIAAATNPFEITALRLARADRLSARLGDRAGARAELAAILHKEPQHRRALSRLADLQYEDGAFAEAAELYISRARSERAPERLREIFLRLGRIYMHQLPDAKRAAGAYGRLLQLDAANREALEALSDLYTAAGENKNALVVTERLVELEHDGARRVAYLVRLGQLWERAGNPRQAGAHFRRAVDEAPRDLQALGELARHLERTHDFAGRRVLLDHALSVLRFEIHEGRLSVETLRTAAPILEWRGKTAAAAAAAQLVAAVADDADAREAVAGWAAPPAQGRSLAALGDSEVDDQLFPPALLPGVRNIFRLLGPSLAKGAPDLKPHNLGRGDRLPRDHAARAIIDAVAAQLGVGDFDVHVKRSDDSRAAAALIAEPGTPPALVLGAEIINLGPAAVRFAAGRTLRLCATHLDQLLRQPLEVTGALVVGVARQFVDDFQHPQVSEMAAAAGVARVGRLLSRKLRQDVMHFALESATGFDLQALVAAVRDGANAVGLLAAGDLPASLAAVLAARGGRRPLTLTAIAADDEALALLNFALSDPYADLCRAME
ncbi:MAG TPA: hypothetical protein VH374_22825 [Polyangia bacterium]|nr:hypothetical protein [Polyangia bacterium]